MEWALIGSVLRRFWFVPVIAGLALALWLTRGALAEVKEELEVERAFAALVVAETRAAAGSPRLAKQMVPAQIAALGRSIAELGRGLERCNASARAHEANDQRRQEEAAGAVAAAERRAAAAESRIGRLNASAGRPRAGAAACEPSETVREIWQ